MDPLRFTFYFLRTLNNNEGLINEQLPQYYEDGHYDIKEEILTKMKDEFYEIFANDYFRKTFCLASISIFKNKCKFENCKKT